MLVLGQWYVHPARLPVAPARAAVQALGRCPGFDATLKATAHRRLHGAQQVAAPVTVAFGSRDAVILRRRWRNFGELPADTRSAPLPGCGHLPMSDDPAAVTDVIVESASRSSVVPPHPVPSGNG